MLLNYSPWNYLDVMQGMFHYCLPFLYLFTVLVISKNALVILKYLDSLLSGDLLCFILRLMSGCLCVLFLVCEGGLACLGILIILLCFSLVVFDSFDFVFIFEYLLCLGIFIIITSGEFGFYFVFVLFVWICLLCLLALGLFNLGLYRCSCCLGCSFLFRKYRRFSFYCLFEESELQLKSLGLYELHLLKNEVFRFFKFDLLLNFELGCCKVLLLNLTLHFYLLDYNQR